MSNEKQKAHEAIDRAAFPYMMPGKTPKELLVEAHALIDAIPERGHAHSTTEAVRLVMWNLCHALRAGSNGEVYHIKATEAELLEVLQPLIEARCIPDAPEPMPDHPRPSFTLPNGTHVPAETAAPCKATTNHLLPLEDCPVCGREAQEHESFEKGPPDPAALPGAVRFTCSVCGLAVDVTSVTCGRCVVFPPALQEAVEAATENGFQQAVQAMEDGLHLNERIGAARARIIQADRAARLKAVEEAAAQGCKRLETSRYSSHSDIIAIGKDAISRIVAATRGDHA
jgi:hypothetical protein